MFMFFLSFGSEQALSHNKQDILFSIISACGTGRDAERQDQGVSFAEAEWKVQGVRNTNPLKVKKKINTTLKLSNAVHASTIKVDEKPTFVKNCTKNLNSTVMLVNANSRSVRAAPTKSEDNRYTLDKWMLYLDSCATHHYFFAKEFFRNIKIGDTSLTSSYNAGTTVIPGGNGGV